MSVPRLWTRFQSQILRRMPDARLQRLLAIPLVGRVVARRIRKAMGLDCARLFGSGTAPISPAMLAWFACVELGAIAVTTNTRSAPAEMEYFANHCGAVAAITQPAYAEMVAAHCRNLRWLAVISHDSGAAPAQGFNTRRGDSFEALTRFPTRFALHGGPKFSPDGRFVFFMSRDGWVTKYDLWNLTVVAEVRAGLNMRNVAVSGDGRWVMAANYLPRTAVLFDADLNLAKRFDATTLDGKSASRVSAVYDAAPRHSFVLALKDLPEVWEISYDPKAAPIYDGLVHDYKMGEAIAKPGYHGVRRTRPQTRRRLVRRSTVPAKG